MIYGVVVIALKLAGVSVVPGYASLLFAVTFLSGIQLAVMGMVGLYVGRIYDEARARPLAWCASGTGSATPDGPVMWQPTATKAQNGAPVGDAAPVGGGGGGQ